MANSYPIEAILDNEYAFAHKALLAEVVKFKKLLSQKKYALLITHPNPDPDALGSLVSCSLLLNQLGIKTLPLAFNNILIKKKIQSLNELKLYTRIRIKKFINNPQDKVILTLDLADLKRIPDYDTIVKSGIPIINIDHHEKLKQPGYKISVNIANTKFESTTEVLFWLSRKLNLKLNQDFATNILMGIFADTEFYQDVNLPKRVFLLIYYLQSIGADNNLLVYEFLRSKPIEELVAINFCMQYLTVRKNYAYIALPYNKYFTAQKKLGKPFDKGMLTEILRNIEKIDFCFVLIESEPNFVSCSLKARTDRVDLNKIAQEFGGGGHKTASAFRTHGNFSVITKKLIAQIDKHRSHN
ncbi:MAG: Phosphoesterase RecJ domain protein [Candidatus Woesebacteria bacterium GW2011_GWA1_39_8]|uniref:Phosphoesterase RecJ domain protein n=1 Tax=Candidatus Woesebacteria bacterium GW2011_GWA1_39_8 TaxID=1618552 RepID=A0A0G0PJB7_9BACT|nr:MAG: Phosphoesterase RecJ domain protein [Candidatus Woesebacteria bacterium GW2011_GWA1_39_8]